MVVYLLWHMNTLGEGEDDGKLIGVYSTRAAAEQSQARASRLPGFRDELEGFVIDTYRLDHDCWTDGFVTVRLGD